MQKMSRSGGKLGYTDVRPGNLKTGPLQCSLHGAPFEHGLEASISAECGWPTVDRLEANRSYNTSIVPATLAASRLPSQNAGFDL